MGWGGGGTEGQRTQHIITCSQNKLSYEQLWKRGLEDAV